MRAEADRWLTGSTTVAAIAAVALWVQLSELNGGAMYDAALFLTIGKLMQRGLLLYRDLWDTKPPGIYLYQSAVFAVLPVAVWSLRLTDFLLYVGAGVLFYRLCAIEARSPLAFFATAVWLYWAHHPDFNLGGFYTEEYSAMGAIAAVAAAARYGRGGGLAWAAASGVAAAAAVLFKHPGAACGVPAIVLISGRRPGRALPLFVLCGALPLLAVVGYFWWRGALDAFLDCQVFELLAQHGVTQPGHFAPWARLPVLFQRTSEQLHGQLLYLVPVAAGAGVALLRPNRWRLAVLSWLVADLVMLDMQRFYFEHYFIQVFPSAILLSAIGAAALLHTRVGEPRSATAVRLTLCVVAVALAFRPIEGAVAQRSMYVAGSWYTITHRRVDWPRDPGGPFEEQLGNYLRAHTRPDERVFIVETGTVVAAYWIADRLPASRYIFSTQVLASSARQAEQIAELERSRPAYVVVADPVPEFYLTRWLEQRYHLEMIDQLYTLRADVWARNDREARAQ
jgi:hypothetical protein